MSWSSILNKVTPRLAEKAARRWGLGSLELVAKSANAVYRGQVAGQVVYLRIIHCEQRDEAFLAAGIDWARHLATHGADVTTAIKSNSGNLLEEIDTVWFAVAWRGIDGTPLDDNITPEQLEAWGHALGQLHRASSSYQPELTRTPNGDFLPEQFTLAQFWCNIQATLESDTELWAAYQELSLWLSRLPQEERLICHGDFRPANAIWDGHKVSLIDFDEPTLAHPEYDIARACLRDDCHPFGHPNHLEMFLRGYQQIRPCNPARVDNYIRVRALLMLAWDMQDGAGQFVEVGRHLVLRNEFFSHGANRLG